RCTRAQKPDDPPLSHLLRSRRERPRPRTAEEREERATSQSIELHSVPATQGGSFNSLEINDSTSRCCDLSTARAARPLCRPRKKQRLPRPRPRPVRTGRPLRRHPLGPGLSRGHLLLGPRRRRWRRAPLGSWRERTGIAEGTFVRYPAAANG